ncbi:DUF1553 domain-containing protein, partial [Candidatus Sumerlaeota bacterium]|nr:DUF1553 domain-containing protein [Candidatus Sumerlaeota bacterium]
VTCARCHDHKFDPIPTADYYSLYGVFASSVEPAELPLIVEPDENDPKYQDYLSRLSEKEKGVEDYRSGKHAEFLNEYRTQAAEYLLAACDGKKQADEDAFQKMARDRKLQHRTVRRWQSYMETASKSHHPVLAAWNSFAALKDDEFTTRAAEVASAIAANSNPEARHNPIIAKLFEGEAPKSMREVADRYEKAFSAADHAWAETLQAFSQMTAVKGQEGIPLPTALPDANQEQIRQILYAPDAPGNIPSAEVEQHMSLEEQAQLRNRRLSVDNLKATHPGRPLKAHVLNDLEKPVKPKILKRGNPANPGDEVPRQFVEVVAGADRKPFEHGSGRLELAQAIASRDNPLTARVLVNRVWMHHFGKGIVTTPSDFGMRSDPPSHPELLDYLARRFMDEGWSLKKLHRWIMLSSAYQESSADQIEGRKSDPENRLLWRFNRRRLDFEGLRDSLLDVAGNLDEQLGGDPVEITEPPYSNRRSVYGFIERQNLPNLFRSFDFASPDVSNPQRFETTVPQQALFLMNSPFVISQARGVMTRPEISRTTDTALRIHEIYREIYRRDPSAEEEEIGRKFIEEEARVPSAPSNRAWQYGYGEFNSESNSLVSFTPLPHWTGSSWQGSGKMPDPDLGWVTLTARGGHPGGDLKHCAIRRWVVPRDGVVRVSGEIAHPHEDQDHGDGIHAHLAKSGAQVADWLVAHQKIEASVDQIEVKEGETLDFIVDCRENESYDSYAWSPKIAYAGTAAPANQIGDDPMDWDAADDFGGPSPDPLNPWEQFTQALLLSNEFVFVD